MWVTFREIIHHCRAHALLGDVKCRGEESAAAQSVFYILYLSVNGAGYIVREPVGQPKPYWYFLPQCCLYEYVMFGRQR